MLPPFTLLHFGIRAPGVKAVGDIRFSHIGFVETRIVQLQKVPMFPLTRDTRTGTESAPPTQGKTQ